MRTRTILMALCGWLTLSAAATADLTVRFDLQHSIVNLGEVFTVDIVADVPIGDAFVGFGMDALFDAAIVGHIPLTDVVIGPLFAPAFAADGDGLAGVLPFGLPAPPPVSGTGIVLATLTFEALQPGTSFLIGGITGGDPFEGFVLPGGGFAPVSFVDGSITVIPAPGAVILGVMGLGMISRRRKSLPN